MTTNDETPTPANSEETDAADAEPAEVAPLKKSLAWTQGHMRYWKEQAIKLR